MVKNLIHIFRTYLITFRYIKKSEIYNSQLTTLFLISFFIMSSIYFLIVTFI